jgi:ornithine cyclodeaminase/alanine dehydrogenase-like protein (mu-crystallin family)
MTRPPLLYLGGDDVRRSLPIISAIETMRNAFKDLASGAVDMPLRTRIDSPARGITLIMPGRSAGISRQVLKLLTFYEGNPPAGLPLIQALVLLTDDATGTPLAVLDGTALTALRTGAAAGVATDALARPGASVAAVFGAGVQARAQLEAVAAVRSLREAHVYDPDTDAADSFARDMSAKLGIAVRREADASSALRGADIIGTATTSWIPVFADLDVADGAHINAIGSYQPEKAEIPPRTVSRARIIVDQREAALEEAGDLLQPLAAGLIGRERFEIQLGDVLLGRAEGRRSASEITLFKSVGLAVQDLYAAARAYENARHGGLGRELPR